MSLPITASGAYLDFLRCNNYLDANGDPIDLMGPAGADGANGPNSISGATTSTLIGLLYADGTSISAVGSSGTGDVMRVASPTTTGTLTADSITTSGNMVVDNGTSSQLRIGSSGNNTTIYSGDGYAVVRQSAIVGGLFFDVAMSAGLVVRRNDDFTTMLQVAPGVVYVAGNIIADSTGPHRFGTGSASTVELNNGTVKAINSSGLTVDIWQYGLKSSGTVYVDAGPGCSVVIRPNQYSSAVQFNADASSTFYGPVAATSINASGNVTANGIRNAGANISNAIGSDSNFFYRTYSWTVESASYDVTGLKGNMGTLGVSMVSGNAIMWGSDSNNIYVGIDTTLSRSAAGVLQVGTATNNAAGSLLLTNLTASNKVSVPFAYTGAERYVVSAFANYGREFGMYVTADGNEGGFKANSQFTIKASSGVQFLTGSDFLQMYPIGGGRWALIGGGGLQLGYDTFSALTVTGNLTFIASGCGLQLKSGTGERAGVTGALVGGVLVITNTTVTATTRVLVTPSVAGGSPGHIIVTRTAGASWTITSTSALDTRCFDYFMVENV